jgi:hypothetical protein
MKPPFYDFVHDLYQRRLEAKRKGIKQGPSFTKQLLTIFMAVLVYPQKALHVL